MVVRKVGILALIVLLTFTIGFFAINGIEWGIYEIRPLAEQIPRGLDLTGGVAVVYEAKELSNPELSRDLDSVYQIMRLRLDSEGYPEATITRQGTGRIRIEIPINESNMVDDPSVITQYLVKPAKIEFRDPENELVFGGEDMKDVYVQNNPKTGTGYVVGFDLNPEAAEAFAKATGKLAGTGKPISILLDGVEISAPTVSGVITGGKAFIESEAFTYETALRLSQQIRSGALPIEMDEIEVRAVSASLGETALQQGLFAGMLGMLLVFAFMVAYYRLPGLICCLSLTIYMIIVLFCLATIPGVQLTLPGIAGIILSIGMAVDANVIIYERMREELISGKTIRTSVKLGFERAFSAIMDSNITTIIAALVLLFFGTGPIKGFAVTLLIGIVVSFFTAVLVTRMLMNLLLGIHFKNKSLFCSARLIPNSQAR